VRKKHAAYEKILNNVCLNQKSVEKNEKEKLIMRKKDAAYEKILNKCVFKSNKSVAKNKKEK
jgi:hypothetical protein